MAKELVSPTGGPSCQYHIMLAKIKLAKNELDEAEKHCCEALSIDYLVRIFIHSTLSFLDFLLLINYHRTTKRG